MQRTLSEVLERIGEICLHEAVPANCSSCLPEKRDGCNESAMGELAEMIYFAFDRFTAEERRMRTLACLPDEWRRDHCEEHKRAHADFSHLLSRLAHDWNSSHPGSSLAEFRRLIGIWLTEHIPDFDASLLHTLAVHCGSGMQDQA